MSYYDAENNQLFRTTGSSGLYESGKKFELALIPEKEKAPNVFDPNNIGSDKVMLDMGVTAQKEDTYGKILSFAYSRTDHGVYVYEINVDADNACSLWKRE